MKGARMRSYSLLGRGRPNQRFGAAADRAIKRPHAHLAVRQRWQPFLADFGASRRDIPERLGNLIGSAGRHFVDPALDFWDGSPCYIVIPCPIRQDIGSRNPRAGTLALANRENRQHRPPSTT